MRLILFALIFCGITFKAWGQTIGGAGVICASEVAAVTVSDDLRNDATDDLSDETQALFDLHVCAYHQNLVATITGVVRGGKYPVLAVESVDGKLHGFLITADDGV